MKYDINCEKTTYKKHRHLSQEGDIYEVKKGE